MSGQKKNNQAGKPNGPSKQSSSSSMPRTTRARARVLASVQAAAAELPHPSWRLVVLVALLGRDRVPTSLIERLVALDHVTYPDVGKIRKAIADIWKRGLVVGDPLTGICMDGVTAANVVQLAEENQQLLKHIAELSVAMIWPEYEAVQAGSQGALTPGVLASSIRTVVEVCIGVGTELQRCNTLINWALVHYRTLADQQSAIGGSMKSLAIKNQVLASSAYAMSSTITQMLH